MAKSITNLLVVPLIASAILLSSPSLALTQNRLRGSEVRHTTSLPYGKKGLAGVVTSVSGAFLRVTSKDNTLYTVDATHATVMQAEDSPENPAIVAASDIKVGDTVVVRGEVDWGSVDA